MTTRKEARDNLNRALLDAACHPLGLKADAPRHRVVHAIDQLIEAVVSERVGRALDDDEHERILADIAGSPGGD